MESSMDFLLWVRGPAFNIAVAIFVIGVLARLFEILVLGRKSLYSEPKGAQMGPGVAEIFKRSPADPGTNTNYYGLGWVVFPKLL